MERFKKYAPIFDKIAAWSLYLLIFALPFGKSIIEITIVTALVSIAIKKIILREGISKLTSLEIALFVFLLACLGSLIHTQYLALSLKALFSKAIKYVLLFLITREIINTREKLYNFLIMALLSAAIIVVDAAIQLSITHVDILRNCPVYIIPELNASFRGIPTASFTYPNDFAAWIIVIIFPAGLYAISRYSGARSRVFSGIVFIGLFYFLLAAKVRGAWVGFMASLVCMSFFKFRKTVIVLLAVFLIGALLVNRSIINRVFDTNSMKERQMIWKNGFEIFKRHPILGNGVNTFFVSYAKVRNDGGTSGVYAHNCYLQMAAEIGVFGLAAFLSFAGILIVRAFKSLRKIKEPAYYSLVLGIGLGLIAFLLHSGVDTNLYALRLAALFWISAGILSATVNIATRTDD